MIKLQIKNFGPIKSGYKSSDDWMDIQKVTVFTGIQGSGKSTVAKTIATLSWLEKALNRGDIGRNLSFDEFQKLFRHQKIHNYFSKETVIAYRGEMYDIVYDRINQYPIISEVNKGNYVVPKIMYVPAERSFFSSIGNAFEIRDLPGNIFDFAVELKSAQKDLNGRKIKLPIRGYSYSYNEDNDTSYILGKKFQLDLLESSSGFQSLVPLFLVSQRLADSIFADEETLRKNLSPSQSIRMNKEISELILNSKADELSKSIEINKIVAKYYNRCFINIVEEPELNLHPTSQWDILKNILEYNNRIESNKLIMTTHSPYLINYLTLSVKAGIVLGKIKDSSNKEKLNQIVPLSSSIKADDLVIYELNEEDGEITKLET